MEVPLAVIARPPAAKGYAVELWPTTANIDEETGFTRGIVLLPIDSTADRPRLIVVLSTT